jgi:outer membrane protein
MERNVGTGFVKYIVVSIVVIAVSAGTALSQDAMVLSLDEAISTALENNPGITISDADIEISRAQVRNSKSAYYPDISTRLVIPFIGRESGFFLDQMIWDFGRTSNHVKASKAQLKSSKYEKLKTREDVILNTIESYYNVLAHQHRTDAARKRTIEFEKRLQQAEGFFRAGRVAQIDVTKAEVNLGNARLDLVAAENEYEAAKVGLLKAMGFEGEYNFTLVDTLERPKMDINLEESIDHAVESRPEIKSMKAQEAAMRANLAATKKEFYPLIFGRTAYRFKGKGAETPGFIAGIGLQFPIFEGFSRFADVQDARARLTRTQAQIAQAKADIASEIKQLRLDLGFAEKNIAVTEQTKRSAEQSLLLARERYRLERASEVELAEAESLFASTNATYMQAIYNYNIAAARLERAIGEYDESYK